MLITFLHCHVSPATFLQASSQGSRGRPRRRDPSGFSTRIRQDISQGVRLQPDLSWSRDSLQDESQFFDRVENLAGQCEKIIQTYGLQQIFETKAGNKKWRQTIISKIKPKPFFDRLGEALANSLDTEIRDDCVEFFEWLKDLVVLNAREH